MKKKLIAILALCGCMAMSVGALAACTDSEETQTCTQHVDADKDGKCDVCGEAMGEAPVTPDDEVKMTDGVYSNVMDATHEALIKLYEDGTVYLAGFTVSYKGWYEVKNEEIKTAAVADDGTIIDDAAVEAGKGEKEWLTFDTAIYFWADAEKTEPIVVNKSAESAEALPSSGVGYAYGTAENALAYDAETDRIYNYKFDQATRTLSHSSLREFTEEDENAIEKYKFMLKNEADLPEDAAADATVSDYYITITQKGFEGNLLGENNVWNGKYTIEGDTYTLNDTFSGGSVGTLTIHADGTATYRNEEKTIELVVWEKVTSSEVKDLLTVTTTKNLGIEVTFSLVFKSNCTAVLSANVMGSVIEITTDWVLESPQIVFSNTSKGEFSYAIDADGAHVTWKGDLSDRMTDQEVKFTFASSELAKLVDAKPSVPAEALLSGDATVNVGIDVTLTLTFFSDHTLTVSGSMMGNNFEVTAKWELQAPHINFSEVSLGEMTYSIDGAGMHVTWKGTLGSAGEQSFVYNFPTSDLAKLNI